MRLSYLFICLSFLVMPVASHAGCEFSEAPPEIPNGATATEPEMLTAQSAIKTYIEHSNAFMECLAEEGQAAGEADTPEAMAERDAMHNAAVDAQQALADSFNAQIKAWKAQ
jgi:hypothetical protein